MDVSRARRPCSRTILAVVFFGAPGVAHVDSQEALPVEIVYRAQGTNCPSQEEFLAEVRTALPVTQAQQSHDARQFIVTLEDDRGTLEVRSKGGHSASHEVRGSSCAEVGSALALSAALAFAPDATSDVAGSDDSTPHTTPPVASESMEPTPATWAVGLGGLGMVGPTPLALGGTVFFDLPHRRGRLLAPVVRLGVAYLQTITPHTASVTSAQSSATSSDGTVSVHWQWFLARADLCELHITDSMDTNGLRLCVAMDAGYIVSHPSVLRNTQTNGKPWLAPGLDVHAFWQISDVLFDFGTELLLPLTRYEYYFDNYTVNNTSSSRADVYQIQPVGWTFSLGASF